MSSDDVPQQIVLELARLTRQALERVADRQRTLNAGEDYNETLLGS